MSLDFTNEISIQKIKSHFDKIVCPFFETDYHVELEQIKEEFKHQIVFRKKDGSNITNEEVDCIKIKISEIYGSRAPFCCINVSQIPYMVKLYIEYYRLLPIEALPKDDLQSPSNDISLIYKELLELGVEIKFRKGHGDYLFIYKDRFVPFSHVNGAERKEITLIKKYLRL